MAGQSLFDRLGRRLTEALGRIRCPILPTIEPTEPGLDDKALFWGSDG